MRACQSCGHSQTPILTQIPLEWVEVGAVEYLLCRTCKQRVTGAQPLDYDRLFGLMRV